MAISTYFGSLASACDGAGKLLYAKHPLAGLILLALSGFFWAGEALTETPPEGTSYWQNIKNKLAIRFDNLETPKMKWTLAAGVLSMLLAGLTLTTLLIGAGPASWIIFSTAALGLALGASWYQSANWNTSSGTCNKIAAGNYLVSSALVLAAVFAPPLAILGTMITLTSYLSTGLWGMSYFAKEIIDPADEWQPAVKAVAPNPQNHPDPVGNATHTNQPYSPLGRLGNGRDRVTLKPGDSPPLSPRPNGY